MAAHLERLDRAGVVQKQRGVVIQGGNRIGSIRICNVYNLDAALGAVYGDYRVVAAIHIKVSHVTGGNRCPFDG